MSAKRLPGKPLLKIKGKTLISLVLKKAEDCKVGKAIVATEDKKIEKEVKSNGGIAILTSKKHKSGTDRIWEAFQKVRDKKHSQHGLSDDLKKKCFHQIYNFHRVF